jgi:nitroreductase
VNKKEELLEVFHQRHACKKFDNTKKISKKDMNFILETGRLSPSSFGMEHWKFLLISNDELKSKLKPYCWNQPQITDCSHIIVVLAKKDILKAGTNYTNNMLARKGHPKDKYEAYLKKYKDFMSQKDDLELISWSHRQCYIASANMATAASYINLDSCMIEGFEKKEVSNIIAFNQNEFDLSMLICFGYRQNDVVPKTRLDFDEIVEFID